MAGSDIWQRITHLEKRILEQTSGVPLPQSDHWSGVVTWCLILANARLHSIRMVLTDSDNNSAMILTRSLFELAVTLWYIYFDARERLPLYLHHGGLLLTEEEVEQWRQQHEAGATPSAIDILPKRPWVPIRQMCSELDSQQPGARWVDQYNTFYRYASVPTHAGAFTLGRDYSRFRENVALSDDEKAKVLATAIAFHLRVAEIAAKTFAEHISIDTIGNLDKECGDILKNL